MATKFKKGDRIRNTLTGHEGVITTVITPDPRSMCTRTRYSARMSNGSYNGWEGDNPTNIVRLHAEFNVGDKVRNTVTGHEGVVISVTAPNYALMHSRTTITARMANGSHNEWKRCDKSNMVHAS